MYNGNESGFESNPHNLKWSLHSKDGYFSISEIAVLCPLNTFAPGVIKAGYYYHSRLQEIDDNNNVSTRFNNRYGFYLCTDNWIKQFAASTLSLITQAALAKGDNQINNLYLSVGLIYDNLLIKDDALCLAFAGNSIQGKNKKGETVIELTYQGLKVAPITLQPDVQYIINPGGEFSTLKNALAGILRFGFNI